MSLSLLLFKFGEYSPWTIIFFESQIHTKSKSKQSRVYIIFSNWSALKLYLWLFLLSTFFETFTYWHELRKLKWSSDDNVIIIIQVLPNLTHLWSMFLNYTPWKHQETKAFLVFLRRLKVIKHELRVANYELRVERLKAWVEIQKCELKVKNASSNPRATSSSQWGASSNTRVTISNPRVTSFIPRVSSSNPRVTSSNRRVTSSNSRITSSNPRVTSLNTRVQESLLVIH